MNEYVTDTMALILRLEKRKMPEQVKNMFLNAEKGKTKIKISVMVLAEIGYLSEKNRIDANLTDVENYINQFETISEYPISFSIIQHAFKIDDIPELHDRIIAATALTLDMPILTNDPIIQASNFVESLW